MSRPCGLWQRKLPFAAGMGSASTTPVLRWWSSSQVGGSSVFGHVSRSGGRQRLTLASPGSEWGRGMLQTGQGPLEWVSEARRALVK